MEGGRKSSTSVRSMHFGEERLTDSNVFRAIDHHVASL